MTLAGRRLIPITDPDDSRVEAFRHIRERDLVGRQGRFVAEGKVVLRMLARSEAFRADRILVLENRVAGISDVLETFDADIPIMTCSRAVIDAVAGFPMHRGVLAIGTAPPLPPLAKAIARLEEDALVVVCNAISNHDNLGSLFRNAAAFCADLVCLDSQCCDPLYRKSIRVSVGSVLTVPYTREAHIETIVEALADAGFEILALSPQGGSPIHAVRPGRRAALVVGTEGEGLPPSLLEKLEAVRIPQASRLDSLNVATAAAIALYSVAHGQGRL
jgi:tRNA G18 (ribose-2'-O)-methylase SpoU